MKNKINDPLESLLNDTFDDYAVPEYQNSWARVKTKLARNQFLKFNPTRFNIFYGLAIVGAVVITAVMPGGRPEEQPAGVPGAIAPSTFTPEDIVLADTTRSSPVIKKLVTEQGKEQKTVEQDADGASETISSTDGDIVPDSAIISRGNAANDASTMIVDTLIQADTSSHLPARVRKKVKKTVYVNEKVVVKDTVVKIIVKKRKGNKDK